MTIFGHWEEYLLSTRLFCGDCRQLMDGESGRGHKVVIYRYYECVGTKRKLGSKKKAVRKQWNEDVVVKLTVSQALTDTAIDRIADAIVVMQEVEAALCSDLTGMCPTKIRRNHKGRNELGKSV